MAISMRLSLPLQTLDIPATQCVDCVSIISDKNPEILTERALRKEGSRCHRAGGESDMSGDTCDTGGPTES